MKTNFFLLLLFLSVQISFAQKTILDEDDKDIDEKIEAYEKLKTDSLPELALNDEIEIEENVLGIKRKKNSVDKKEGKKKFYQGVRIKKGYASKNAESVEIFRYTKFAKDPEDPSSQEVYFYDYSKKSVFVKPYKVYREIVEKGINVRLLHGAYQEKAGKAILAEGFYYLGTRHGRWMHYDQNYILTEKQNYNKGYLEDAIVTNHSNGKVKEIMPMVNGDKHGKYFAYHENGFLATSGHYEHNVQVGIWYDYHTNGKKKRQTQYPRFFHLKDKSYIVYEWDTNGNLTYDYKRNGGK